MTQMGVDAVQQAGTNFLESVGAFLPRTLVTVSLLVVGWLLAAGLRFVVRTVLARLRFNAACERLGVLGALRAAELPAADIVVSRAVFWIVWIGFLLSGVDALGITILQGLADEFGRFLPRLLVAVAILVAGFALANFAWRATLLAAVNARVPSPRLLSGAVRALVLILALAMALEQIAVARTIVLTAFAIAFGATMLGLAIAFGVGGGSVARRILEHWFPERPKPDGEEIKHL
jgi:hypothetical protein